MATKLVDSGEEYPSMLILLEQGFAYLSPLPPHSLKESTSPNEFGGIKQ